VQSVTETTPGIPDESVLSRAETTVSILVTIDKDFGELIYRQRRLSHGIILLRLEELPAPRKAVVLETVLRLHETELAQAFTVITQQQVRIRPLRT
jgi:predicted nuclease of predicted toxin-antitoxin system